MVSLKFSIFNLDNPILTISIFRMNRFYIVHRLFLLTSFLFLASLLPAQILRGTITDKDSGRPLVGVSVSFRMDQRDDLHTSSDSTGAFRLVVPGAGTGILVVENEGYVPFSLSEVTVAAGKDKVVAVLMTSGTLEASIPVVDIVEVRPLRQSSPIGEIPLSREQTLYYPMTYFDPARLAMSWPGVAQTDDGTNAMSIRGNNSAFVRWRLQGLDIVSPNHLPNAGTFTDRPSVASGGVLMLSAQMIDNSSLITGAGTVGYNDGIGGIMDLQLRKGNDQRHEQTIQAGLTGLDAAIEGPLSKKKGGASYLMNYRYSTVGLLGKLGVSFGGEKIGFQDIAMHFNFPSGKRGNLSVYGLGGKSSNIFTPPDSVVIFKDLFNIDYYSRTGVVGITHTGYLGSDFSIKSGISISGQSNDREQRADTIYSSDFQSQVSISANSSMRYKVASNTTLLFGTNFSIGDYQLFDNKNPYNSISILDGDFALQGWFASETALLNGAVKIHLGVNPIVSYYGHALDPRLQVFWRPSQTHQLMFSLASYSQGVPIWANVYNGKMLHSLQYAVRYQWVPVKKWVFSAELFRQSITNLPVSRLEENAFSIVNEIDPNINRSLDSKGVGTNTGIELMGIHKFSLGWFTNANLTLLRSEYEGSDGIVRRTRWDIGHVANLTVGKEWQRKIKKRLSARIIGVDSRVVWMGGARTLPIDITQSANNQTTIFDYSNGYSGQNGDYFRIDGRVYWKRSIANRRNSTFALEFQNLTAQKNIAFQYYDAFTQKVETKYQLGLIPNVSWRLEF